MDLERWEKIEGLVRRALEIDEASRAEFLRLECGDDPELLGQVESALSEISKDDSFLEPVSPGEAAQQRALPKVAEVHGDYRFDEELGRGGTGVVFRAWQFSLERDVAIKILHRPSSDGDQVPREARLIARMDHPGIVPVHAIEEHSGTYWLVMEYVRGHDLSREIEALRGEAKGVSTFLGSYGDRGFITRATTLIAQAAEALHHAHQRGVVHRDVKPHNLLLKTADHPLWVDFGLARDVRFGAPQHESPGGTVHYMSPEQARVPRGPLVDKRTDIYSLGVVLYELLTLKRPFDGKTPKEIIDNLLRKEAISIRKLSPRVPRDLSDVCAMAMCKYVEERYLSAQAFAEDLKRFLAHEAVYARKPSLLRDSLRFFRRYRRRIITALLAAALLLILLFFVAREAYKSDWPLVSLRIEPRDGQSVPTEAVAFLREIDLLSGVPQELRELAALPIRHYRLPEGQYRLIVRFDGERFVEYTRFLTSKSRVEIVVRAPPEDAMLGMVKVDAGGEPFHPWFRPNSPCPNAERAVNIAPYWIDTEEVSNGEYRTFLDATAHPRPTRWAALESWQSEWDSLPVVGISWGDARAYAEWAGKRLPTHPEWELAARGRGGFRYPWGNEPDAARGNSWREKDAPARIAQTSAEAYLRESFAVYAQHAVSAGEHRGDVSPFGAFQMLGNVAEFTASILVEEPRSQPRFDSRSRYVMGGSWYHSQGRDLTYHMEWGVSPSHLSHWIGFRCARSESP